ncbi:MAG TPA: hypothetical protein VMJ72_02285 [Candidatus Paceibacterota bacterium]|nr:hypothetical protein [Candidatus Paceibacterota bacterium]
MPSDLTQRKGGLESLAEGSLEPAGYPSIDQLNGDFVRRMAERAVKRRRSPQGTDADALGAIERFEESYKRDFVKFWEAPSRKMTVDKAAAEAAWRKVQRAAMDRYTQLRDTPQPPERPVGTETPAFIADPDWAQWEKMAFSPATLEQFNDVFASALAHVVHDRSVNMQTAKSFYQDKLFRMYLNGYPDITPDEFAATRTNIQLWLDQQWNEVRAKAGTMS